MNTSDSQKTMANAAAISATKTSYEEPKTIWSKIAALFKPEDTKVMTADSAYCKSTYGKEMDAKTLIKMHQQRINQIIRDRTQYRTNGDTFTDYRCVYAFTKDTIPYIDEILQIFKDKGYSIINISERVEEIKDEHMYLISWYKNNI